MFMKFLDINTYVVVAIIDMAIIAIVPNPLSMSEHIFVALAAAVIVVLIYFRIRDSDRTGVRCGGREDLRVTPAR